MNTLNLNNSHKENTKKNERFAKLVISIEKKIEQLNKEEENKKKERPNTIEVVCSQDDIERTAKRKR